MKNISLFVVGLFLISNAAFAENCYDQSPNFVSLGDDYFNLESQKKLSTEDSDKLNELLRTIQGKWVGNVVISDCKGSNKAPRKVEKTASVKVDILVQSILKISAEMIFNDNGASKLRSYKLLENKELFNYEFKNDTYFIYSTIVRTRNGKKGSRLVENIYKINFENGNLNFTVLLYMNGVFVGDEVWTLREEY